MARKGGNPNIVELGKATQFKPKSVSSHAVEAAYLSHDVIRSQKEQEAIIDKYMGDLLDMAFGNCTLKEFQQKANEAPSQALRVAALNLANPKTSLSTLQWLIERVKGRPKQSIEQQQSINLESEKPIVVFRDSRDE